MKRIYQDKLFRIIAAFVLVFLFIVFVVAIIANVAQPSAGFGYHIGMSFMVFGSMFGFIAVLVLAVLGLIKWIGNGR